MTNEDPEQLWARNRHCYQRRWSYYSEIRADMGDAELEMALQADRQDHYREFELIGPAEAMIETLRGFKDGMPITDFVHSGPAAGIPIRSEAYHDLKAFADTVLPELKSW